MKPQHPGYRRLIPYGFVLLLLWPYLVKLGTSSIWDANEAFYAETPREMIESGDYLTPTFNYQLRAQKPPLTYWVILPFYKAVGIRELSVRLPGILAVAGLLCFVYRLGNEWFGPKGGWLAAAITATSLRVFVLARKLPIDILLLFWLIAAAYYLTRTAQTSSPRAYIAAYLCMGFGFLTKGPVAVLLPLGSYLVWSVVARRFSLRALHPAAGPLVLFAVVAPWYIWTYAAHGWTYILPFLFRDNLGRFLSEPFGPSRGIFYYLPTFLADFFPWSVLSIAAVLQAFKDLHWPRLIRSLELGFPLIWSVLIVLFFSLSRNKQEYYIASVYPMMALFLSGVVVRTAPSDGIRLSGARRLGWRLVFLALVCLMAAAALGLPALAAEMLPGFDSPLRFLPSVLLLAGAVLIAFWSKKAGLLRCTAALAATIWMVLAAAAWIYIPAMENLRPVRDLCRLIEERALPQDEVGYYRITAPSMAFYLRRQIFEEYEAASMLRRLESGRSVFCIAGSEDLEKLQRDARAELHVIARRPRLVTRLRVLLEMGRAGQELILISNRPYPDVGRTAGRAAERERPPERPKEEFNARARTAESKS